MFLRNLIPAHWKEYLSSEFEKPYFIQLEKEVEEQYAQYTIFPSKENIFASLSFCKPEEIKVVILGQDPYIKEGQAHGLSFSVKEGTAFPKSLINIFKELSTDEGCPIPSSGCLENWAKQGVLLLNTILTVRENASNSHISLGWQKLTQKIMQIVLNTNTPKVFILWGNQAKQAFLSCVEDEETNINILSQEFKKLDCSFQYDNKKCLILTAPHPSPLSAYRGFFNSKPFSKTNNFLLENNTSPIIWRL